MYRNINRFLLRKLRQGNHIMTKKSSVFKTFPPYENDDPEFWSYSGLKSVFEGLRVASVPVRF